MGYAGIVFLLLNQIAKAFQYITCQWKGMMCNGPWNRACLSENELKKRPCFIGLKDASMILLSALTLPSPIGITEPGEG
jgi:hypothetical protein